SPLALSFLYRTPTIQISTLSLHDALPISRNKATLPYDLGYTLPDQYVNVEAAPAPEPTATPAAETEAGQFPAPTGEAFVPFEGEDRKSTRLNSSHVKISYAVFCLKKKK